MNLLSQDAGEVLLRGYRWWTGELTGLVPETVRRVWRGKTADASFILNDGRLELGGQSSRRFGGDRQGTSDASCWAWIAELGQSKPGACIHLHIPQADCHLRTVDVPIAAVGQAASILALDLERATPFEADEIYTAHVADDDKPAPGRARLRQFIVKRELMDPIIERIETAGLRVERASVLAADGKEIPDADLLSSRRSHTGERRGNSIGALSILTAALALSAALITISRTEAAVADLEEQVRVARASVAAAGVEAAGAIARGNDLQAVHQLVTARPEMVRVLNELTRTLPDTAWLTDVRIANGNVDISGFALQAASLPPVLEASEMFEDAALTAPVTLDSSRNQEQFSFRLRLGDASSKSQSIPPTPEGQAP